MQGRKLRYTPIDLLLFLAVLLALMLIHVTATSAADTSTQLRHSNDVVRFFDNHHWMRAIQQPNCLSVPWTKTCRIARKVYAHHKNKIAQLEHWYQYAWQDWLPAGWYGIGSCETGYGGAPNWRHNSGTYQGAFGFAVSSWDAFVGSADPKAGPYPSEAYEATPRQQYEVALAIYRRYGLSGWGCRGAYYR